MNQFRVSVHSPLFACALNFFAINLTRLRSSPVEEPTHAARLSRFSLPWSVIYNSPISPSTELPVSFTVWGELTGARARHHGRTAHASWLTHLVGALTYVL